MKGHANELRGVVKTGCDVTFCWMIHIRIFQESSAPPGLDSQCIIGKLQDGHCN